MEHSPLPWMADRLEIDDNVFAKRIISSDYRIVIGSVKMREKDALFIVEAANNYESLQKRVAELEEALNDLLLHSVGTAVIMSQDYRKLQCVNKAMQLLNKE